MPDVPGGIETGDRGRLAVQRYAGGVPKQAFGRGRQGRERAQEQPEGGHVRFPAARLHEPALPAGKSRHAVPRRHAQAGRGGQGQGQPGAVDGGPQRNRADPEWGERFGVLRKRPDAVAVAGVHGKAQGFQRKNLKKGVVREREGVGRERAAQCASVRVLAEEDQPEHEPAPGHAAGPCGQQRTGGAHPPPAQRAGAAAIQRDGGDEGPHERGALGPAAGVEGPGKECFKSHRGLRGRDGARPVGHGPAPSWAKPFRFETAFFQRRSTPKNGG